LQHLVAGLVAQHIVDFLELVQVDHQQQQLAGALGQRHHFRAPGVKVGAVG
jgi:hypothetical protein